MTGQENASAWAQRHFDGLDLGDPRRNKRVVVLGKMMAQFPGKSIPGMSNSDRAPLRRGVTDDMLECNAVRIWEQNPPAEQKPLEWILLTDRQVDNFDQALEVALMYSSRWLIEEYHMRDAIMALGQLGGHLGRKCDRHAWLANTLGRLGSSHNPR